MKKWISRLAGLILAGALSLPLCAPALAADGGFSDVSGSHWAYGDIMACVEQGAAAGFEDGTFRPEDYVTGTQFIAMLTRAFYAGELDQAVTPDGQPWYWPYVSVAEETGLSAGITVAGTAVSRYDAAEILYNEIRIADKKPDAASVQLDSAVSGIEDWSSIPGSHQAAIVYCYALGVLSGMPDGTFHGDQPMTRAQACAVLVQMMELINSGEPHGTTAAFLANGEEATEANAAAILDGLRESYPDGMVWDVPGTEGNHYYAGGDKSGSDIRRLRTMPGTGLANVSMNYACGGFAALVSDEIFGLTGAPAREVAGIADARAGDILVWYGGDDAVKHVAVFLSAGAAREDGAGVTCWDAATANGNCDGKVRWDLDLIIAGGLGPANYYEAYGYYRIFTRYPTDQKEAL